MHRAPRGGTGADDAAAPLVSPLITSLITDVASARALVAGLADERIETADVLYLNPKWRLCGRRRFVGAPGAVTIPVRALIAAGLVLDARYVVLAHNHPSGDPEPSARDLAFTRRLADALRLIEMPLADHLIVTRDAITSFRERKLL